MARRGFQVEKSKTAKSSSSFKDEYVQSTEYVNT